MLSTSQQIEAIEKEIRETPYHKGTEHHIGKLRAKLSVLKDRVIESEVISKGGGGGGYAVKKQGDATVILVGPPSAGKSTLINQLTNAKSKIAPYAFTTVSVIPGMMKHKDTNIQILDVPGLIEGAEEGKGRGREVLSVARGADLVILITDVMRTDAFDRIAYILHKNGARLDEAPPQVKIEKKLKGGLIIHSNLKQDFSKADAIEMALAYGIKSAEITIKEKLTLERLADAFSKNRVYVPSLLVLNKIDQKPRDFKFDNNEHKDLVEISAETGLNIEKLKEAIWNKLGFVRIYLVKRDEEPNFENPVVVKSGTTLFELATLLGSEFIENKKSAKIWGPTAKFPGQETPLSTRVIDEMQVKFI